MPIAVTFSFDPGCPWTWRTSRWLVGVAPERDLRVEWRAFSLLLLRDGDVPEDRRERLESGHAALRLVEALQAEGRNDDAARFYTELGERVHDRGEALTATTVRAAADAAKVDELAAALDDERWDAAVRRSHDAAFAAAGPDIGSPVLQVEGLERGLHGPILGEVPPPEQSLTIWDCVCRLIGCSAFYEMKRGRG